MMANRTECTSIRVDQLGAVERCVPVSGLMDDDGFDLEDDEKTVQQVAREIVDRHGTDGMTKERIKPDRPRCYAGPVAR